MFLVLIVLALIAGVVTPVQAGINAELRRHLGGPVDAALASFLIGTVALIAVAVAIRSPVPSRGQLADIPWWQWTGGPMGAYLVAVVIVLAPRLGAAFMVSLLVAGQMLASLLLDQWGLIGYPVHQLNAWRALGGVLIVAGVVLMRVF